MGSFKSSLFLGLDLNITELFIGLSFKTDLTGVLSLIPGPSLLVASMSGLHVTGKRLLPLCCITNSSGDCAEVVRLGDRLTLNGTPGTYMLTNKILCFIL